MKLVALRKWTGSITQYLPLAMMALLALGSWWLARNTPDAVIAAPERVQRQEPDYYLTRFSVKNFDAQGVLMSEVFGEKAKHFPVTDILEINQARFSSRRQQFVTTGQSDRAYSNGDGSEVQLVGNALVVREASLDRLGKSVPRMEIRGDFLHAFLRTEEIKSHLPVTIRRGEDQFSGDSMLFNKIDSVVELNGRVRVRLEPRTSSQSRQ